MTERDRSTDGDEASRLRWLRPGRFLRDLNISALLLLIAAAAALFMSPRSDDVLLGLPDLALGDRSPHTIRSPRALTISDPENTKELRDEAARKVAPVFDQEIWLVEHAEKRVANAFALLVLPEPLESGPAAEPSSEAAADGDSRAVRLARSEAFQDALGVVLGKPTLTAVLDGPPDEMRDAVLSVLSTVGKQPIVARSRDLPVVTRSPDDPNLATGSDPITVLHVAQDERPVREILIDDPSSILTLDQARARVDALAAERLAHLPRRQRRAAAVLVKELLEDNLVRNAAESRRRRRLARDSVKAVVIAIEPGEVVVKAGAPVDEQKLRILQGIAAELRATSRVQVTAGSVLLVMLLVAFAYRLAAKSYQPARPAARDLAFMATAVLLAMVALWAGHHGVAYAIDFVPGWAPATLRMGLPVAFAVLLVRLVAGTEPAAVFVAVVAVMAGWIMDANLPFAVYTLAGGLAAASISDSDRLGRSLFKATNRIIFAQLTVAMAFSLLESSLDLNIAAEYLAAATVSGVASTVLAWFALATCEAVFGYATLLRLGQLANLNHPLLKQMLVEAPGTYHHSILVGTMAEAGARAIGAHPLLARVGGYYHDIGKLKNPRAFDENDGRDVGPVDAAQANELSAHVADGIELAIQHRLGASVIDIIRQHHGTARVRRRSLSSSPPGPVTDVVTYAGPKPSARETALVMLADAIEASTRHLTQEIVVDRARVERAVFDATQVLLLDGQLDECALSLRDLDLTRRAFVEVLEARLSRRGRPLGTLPEVTGTPMVRAPAGEPN